MRLRPIALLLLALSLPAAAAPLTVAGLTETYAHPTLGKPTAMNGLTFESGHMKITFGQGSAAPVLAGGETIGLFFKGSGSFEYRSEDPVEAAVMMTNLKEATKLKGEASGNAIIVRDTFDEVFLRIAGRAIPQGSGDGTSLDAAFTEHREAFSRDREGAPELVFVKQKIDAPDKPLVRAQFRGGKESLVYLFDPVDSESETLYSLHKFRQTSIRELQRANWGVVLSEQPIGRSRKAFQEPSYLLYDLDYTLTAGEGSNGTLSVVETLIPRRGAQQVFAFDQLGTVYDTNGKAHHFNVRSVKDENGKDLSFVHEEDQLLVGLPIKIAPNSAVKVRFEIDGDFLIRPSGDSYWELGTEPWFPQPDLNGQFYTIHSTVKVKKPFIAFAPGTTVRRVEEGDFNVVENRVDKPVQFAVVLAGKYFFDEETQNGLTIRVASYAGKNTRAMKKLSNLAFKIIEFYEPFLGKFPFSEFNIIEINEFGYGQAPPATMFITQEAFNPVGGELNQIFSQGINHRFAHEIAHQYWGHVVKMGSADEQWVTEAFAEYTSSFVVKQIKGKDSYNSMVATWKANAKDVYKSSSIATANRLRDFSDPRMAFLRRTFLIYDKGAYLLSQLHKDMGDDMFFSFLLNLQRLHAWRYTTTTDMITLLQHLTKKDYGPFFEQNFWGTGMP